MTTEKFLPFLLGLVLLADCESLLRLTLLDPVLSAPTLPMPAPALFPAHSGLCYLASMVTCSEQPQALTASLSQQHFAFYCNVCRESGHKVFYTTFSFPESCLCCKPSMCMSTGTAKWRMKKGFASFLPSSCFPSLSNSSEKSSSQLPALHSIWPCPIHLHLSSFAWMWMQRCRIDPYPAVPAVNLAGHWCSCQLQPFILNNVCLSPGFCLCYFLLSLPCSAAWDLPCPGCHPAYAEPWVINPAEFLSLSSALSVSCFCSALCHEQQLLWFLSGHHAVWCLPCHFIMLSSAPLAKIFTFKESSPVCFLCSVKMASLGSWLGHGACERIWSCSLRCLGIILWSEN